jgi:NitT/TauT family transport system substrate-binding protein
MGAAEAVPTTGQPIKLGLSIWAPSFLPFVAQEKGFFEKNNVNVQLTLIPDYLQTVEDYHNGDVDGMIGVFADVLFQNSEGIDSKVVYMLDYSNTADVIVGKSNHDVNKYINNNSTPSNDNNLSYLKGKKIGVEGINSFSHMFVLKALELSGLKEGDIEFVNVPAQNVTRAIEDGEIDAGHSYQPYTTEALKKGYKVLFTAGTIPGLVTDVLVFHSNIVEQRPKDIQAVIKSIVEAQNYYVNNKTDAVKIMSIKSGIDEHEIMNGLDSVALPSLKDNINIALNSNVNETTSLYVSGKDIAEFYINRGQISEYLDLNQIIDSTFANDVYGIFKN